MLIFIGLELMAISTYVLVGFCVATSRSNEAALKYLLLGAFSSGIFAYGLSLFYGLTGSTNLRGHQPALGRRCRMANHAYEPDRDGGAAGDGRGLVVQDCSQCRSINGRRTLTKARLPASQASCRLR